MKWVRIANMLPHIPGMTHAAMPAYHEGQLYFSPRDSQGRSHIYRSDFNLSTLTLGEPEPVIGPGRPGDFDDSGAMVSWVERDGPRVMLYFIGWNLGVTVPFRNSIGLAVNDEKFIGPVLDRNRNDPLFVASCCRLQWYVSGLGWGMRGGKFQPIYTIVNAHPHSTAIIFKNLDTEWAIARPCVIKGHGYEMWYCYRGEEYRLGYAASRDGLQWTRFDEQMGINLGQPGDFDDKAQCYPFVFDADGKRWMFYNGNNYGRTGFGLAVME